MESKGDQIAYDRHFDSAQYDGVYVLEQSDLVNDERPAIPAERFLCHNPDAIGSGGATIDDVLPKPTFLFHTECRVPPR